MSIETIQFICILVAFAVIFLIVLSAISLWRQKWMQSLFETLGVFIIIMSLYVSNLIYPTMYYIFNLF